MRGLELEWPGPAWASLGLVWVHARELGWALQGPAWG